MIKYCGRQTALAGYSIFANSAASFMPGESKVATSVIPSGSHHLMTDSGFVLGRYAPQTNDFTLMSSMRLLPDASPPAHNRAEGRPSTNFSPTVLVVDDHEDSRLLIRYLMEQRGCRVIEAADGLEAVETAHNSRPDLILMDVGLPLLDGLSATRRIRQDVEMHSVPIVAVSGYAMAEDQTKALVAGCDGYITKPIDFDELYHLLNRFLLLNTR